MMMADRLNASTNHVYDNMSLDEYYLTLSSIVEMQPEEEKK